MPTPTQAPQILPLPLLLVSEGGTFGFTTLGVDAECDPHNLSLIYDSNTPTGVFYDPKSAYFEWTPGQDIVNNATATDKPYTQWVIDQAVLFVEVVQRQIAPPEGDIEKPVTPS